MWSGKFFGKRLTSAKASLQVKSNTKELTYDYLSFPLVNPHNEYVGFQNLKGSLTKVLSMAYLSRHVIWRNLDVANHQPERSCDIRGEFWMNYSWVAYKLQILISRDQKKGLLVKTSSINKNHCDMSLKFYVNWLIDFIYCMMVMCWVVMFLGIE